MHLRDPIVVSFLIRCKLPVDGLLEWRYTPRLWRVCRVGPHPLTMGKDPLVVLEGAGASESPHVVNAACVMQRVINDKKVLWLTDDLKWEVSTLSKHLRG
jgi:hypothetical protein